MHSIREFLSREKEYFASNRESITEQNNRMLGDGCIFYAAVLAFYTVFTLLTPQPAVLRNMYFFFDAVHILLCFSVLVRSRLHKIDFRSTQIFSALLEISILGFFGLEGVFTSRTEHSLYIPIAILLVILLFTHSSLYTGVLTMTYLVGFSFLSFLYKTQTAFVNDLYIALATLMSSVIGYTLIQKMRCREAEALSKYEILSRTDALTGLYNKSAIERRCTEKIEDSETMCAFIIFDLDNFKSINDSYGHSVGDEVLSKVARCVKDSFGKNDCVGRFGGDEFIVLAESCKKCGRRTEKV